MKPERDNVHNSVGRFVRAMDVAREEEFPALIAGLRWVKCGRKRRIALLNCVRARMETNHSSK